MIVILGLISVVGGLLAMTLSFCAFRRQTWTERRMHSRTSCRNNNNSNNSNTSTNNNRNNNDENINNSRRRRRQRRINQQQQQRKMEISELPWKAAIIQIIVTVAFCFFLFSSYSSTSTSTTTTTNHHSKTLSCHIFALQFLCIELIVNVIHHQLSTKLPPLWIQYILMLFQTMEDSYSKPGRRYIQNNNNNSEDEVVVFPEVFSITIASILLKPHPYTISAFLIARVTEHAAILCRFDFGSIEIKMSAN